MQISGMRLKGKVLHMKAAARGCAAVDVRRGCWIWWEWRDAEGQWVRVNDKDLGLWLTSLNCSPPSSSFLFTSGSLHGYPCLSLCLFFFSICFYSQWLINNSCLPFYLWLLANMNICFYHSPHLILSFLSDSFLSLVNVPSSTLWSGSGAFRFICHWKSSDSHKHTL